MDPNDNFNFGSKYNLELSDIESMPDENKDFKEDDDCVMNTDDLGDN